MNSTSLQESARRAGRLARASLAALALCYALGGGRAAGQSLLDLPGPAPGRAPAAGLSAFDGGAAPIEGRIDPETYRVGPGDEFAFRHSDLLDAQILRVNPSGDLLLPDAGAVPLAGLTLRQAEARIRESLRAYVRGKGLVFTLHRPRRFRLPVLGDVSRPGLATLQAPARASEAIEAAGGIAAGGARRGIEIRRPGDTLRVDLVRFERTGSLDANPLVFENDVVYVPPSRERIDVRGAVAHAGRFDFVEGDRLSGAVALAGGLRPGALPGEAVLSRFEGDGEATAVAIRLEAALSAPGSEDDVALERGDRLFIPGRSHFLEGAMVEVAGEVLKPGPYPIRDGVDRVRSVIERAGGLTAFAEPWSARILRVLEGGESDTAFLHLARTREDWLSRDERNYVLLQARERRAVSADLGALLTGGAGARDVALRDGDLIVVPRRSLVVSVQGEVRVPGLVPYEAGWRASDYIRAAGGTTNRADRRRARVTRAATQSQVGASEAGALHEGDVIWVPARPDRGGWGILKETIATAAQVATIVLVIRETTR